MYTESDCIMISALQHYLFCKRQCALIHVEQSWEENRLTAKGRLLHERVHEQNSESRGDTIISRGLRLRSLVYGICGQADVVEFHASPHGVHLTGHRDTWIPFPIEYKKGKPEKNNCDAVQLCAQAICLEEMLGIAIPYGALFYGKTRRRMAVAFDDALREETVKLIDKVHQMFTNKQVPPPIKDKRCTQCSMLTICLPDIPHAKGYRLRRIGESLSIKDTAT
ncbi:MAG: CRISPR-associated protein Cas4 [Chitinivibrionales bacterium]|nr:CRISPR-associated protein Cas4 [Chitinivibrionales bacterium]MBD3358306.1 CRISPR-associated protein Cas4 [Chitinivibrionales bacterium]